MKAGENFRKPRRRQLHKTPQRDRHCGSREEEASLVAVKKPTQEEKLRMCTRKRRYLTQGDALEAAMVAGVERHRKAYLCSICQRWHLTSS
jgi:hypothetical protein